MLKWNLFLSEIVQLKSWRIESDEPGYRKGWGDLKKKKKQNRTNE